MLRIVRVFVLVKKGGRDGGRDKHYWGGNEGNISKALASGPDQRASILFIRGVTDEWFALAGLTRAVVQICESFY